MRVAFSCAIVFAFTGLTLKGQEGIPSGVYGPQRNPCGGFIKENIGAKKAIPYTHLREADAAFEKRIWRDIDMREKQNLPLYYPLEINPCRQSLFQVISQNIMKGNIIAFADEDFQIPLDRITVRGKLVKEITMARVDYDENGDPHDTMVTMVDSTDIYRRVLKYRLKEDWFFDRQKSSLEVRVVGLAAYEWDEDKEAFRELFWVYFPECRPYLAANDVYNVKSDSERRSMDDIFWKRMFASTVVKESNVYDRYINEYQKGIDALVESEKVKSTLFTWEHDLWNY
jgi:gliding motility associated protien GldN